MNSLGRRVVNRRIVAVSEGEQFDAVFEEAEDDAEVRFASRTRWEAAPMPRCEVVIERDAVVAGFCDGARNRPHYGIKGTGKSAVIILVHET